MEILDLHLRVEGYPTLDQPIRGSLAGRAPFEPLANSLKAQLAKEVQPAANWLTAEVEGSAVFLAEDWVTSIHSSSLLRCVATMCLVVNAIREELNAPVSILLLNPIGDRNTSLFELVRDEIRRRRNRDAVKWGATAIISGLIGALICELVGRFW